LRSPPSSFIFGRLKITSRKRSADATATELGVKTYEEAAAGMYIERSQCWGISGLARKQVDPGSSNFMKQDQALFANLAEADDRTQTK